MNIRTLFTLLSILWSVQLGAQDNARYDEKIKKATAVLNLTADQQAKYKTLLINTDREKETLIAKSKTVSAEEKKRMQQEFKLNYEKQLRKILTPEQFRKLSEGNNTRK